MSSQYATPTVQSPAEEDIDSQWVLDEDPRSSGLFKKKTFLEKVETVETVDKVEKVEDLKEGGEYKVGTPVKDGDVPDMEPPVKELHKEAKAGKKDKVKRSVDTGDEDDDDLSEDDKPLIKSPKKSPKKKEG